MKQKIAQYFLWFYQHTQAIDVALGLLLMVTGTLLGLTEGFGTFNSVLLVSGLLSIILGKMNFTESLLSRFIFRK